MKPGNRRRQTRLHGANSCRTFRSGRWEMQRLFLNAEGAFLCVSGVAARCDW